MKKPQRLTLLEILRSALTIPGVPEHEREALALGLLMTEEVPWVPQKTWHLYDEVALEFTLLQTMHGRMLRGVLITRGTTATEDCLLLKAGMVPLPELEEVFVVAGQLWHKTFVPWLKRCLAQGVRLENDPAARPLLAIAFPSPALDRLLPFGGPAEAPAPRETEETHA